MELVFPLGVLVALLGGGAVVLGGIDAWWSHHEHGRSAFATAAWQWCLAFVTAVAALMLAHVTSFGLTVPGVTRVIGELGVVWGSERWSDALALALDPVAAAILAGPVLLAAVTAFVDTARPTPTGESRRRGVAMTLALAGLACVAMARSQGGSWAGWVTVGAASLLAAWPGPSRRTHTVTDACLRHETRRWSGLVRREVASAVLVALAGACIAWVMPSWAFDPVALAAATGDGSPLRQAGPFGAPVAETITVALVVASLLRIGVSPSPTRAVDAPPDAASDTLAVIRDLSAIALLVRYDVVAALAPVPLAGLGVLAAIGAVVSAIRLAASDGCAASSAPLAVDPRPAAGAVALLAMASFVPELAIAVCALAGTTWWALRRVPPEGTRRDGVLRLLLAPIPVGLGLAIVCSAVSTWTHVSALSPILNVLASLACVAVGVALALAAAVERRGMRGSDPIAHTGARPEGGGEVPLEARRAARVIVAGATLAASALLVPMSGGSPIARAFAAHAAIPRALTGVYAVGPAQGWGDRAAATWVMFGLVVAVFLVATTWAVRSTPEAPRRGTSATRSHAFVTWLDGTSERVDVAASTTLRGIGRALEFAVSRVAWRDFAALASDELDRAAIASPTLRARRSAMGLTLLLALVLGAVFANRDAATFTPTSLHGFPGLRARLGAADEAALEREPARRLRESSRGAEGGS